MCLANEGQQHNRNGLECSLGAGRIHKALHIASLLFAVYLTKGVYAVDAVPSHRLPEGAIRTQQ